MLAIQSSNPQRRTPNLLPARIHHDGPIPSTSTYWTPTTDENGTKHAYFRGRHLYGTSLPLPTNYTGAVLNITEKDLPESNAARQEIQDVDGEEDGDAEDMKMEVKVAEKIGTFDEVVVWGHGGTVGEEDMYARAVGEWVGFAESMHVEEEEGGDGKDKK